MKITFNVNYVTAEGETLHAVLHRAYASAKENQLNIPLKTNNGRRWTGTILLDFKQPVLMAYHYEVRKGSQIIRREYEHSERTLFLQPQTALCTLQDHWLDTPANSYLLSCAFNVLCPAVAAQAAQPQLFKRTIALHVQAPKSAKGQTLWICGNAAPLGNWRTDKALPMTEQAPNDWVIYLDADTLPDYTEYKFLLKDDNSTQWQEGSNCILQKPALAEGELYVSNEFSPRFAKQSKPHFAGVVVPVFSLRGKQNWGVGDFGNLKMLTDWAEKTGQHIIQLLPINDTSLTGTWTDSYPYNAVSVYALHPLYADVNNLAGADKPRAKALAEQAQKLNGDEAVFYEKALAYKLERLRLAFDTEGARVLTSKPFQKFFVDQVHWLPAYAMYCVLRDEYKTGDFRKWGKYAVFSHAALVQFTKPDSGHYAQICFWYYVQFILHTQLREAARYAREHGVCLKGDIPIGVSRNGADAWTTPSLFNLDTQAGAPPDAFSKTGQNWGFPTYNWDLMAKDNYRWWRRRLTHMAQYFDLYRLDHVLGFLRIWEIPYEHVQGLMGHFSPALPLCVDEIKNFGLAFNPAYLFPHITEDLLQKTFGGLTQQVKDTYLVSLEHNAYSLKPAYDTQRKIEKLFAGKDDETSRTLREGLYRLVANVLFIADAKQPDRYHPRIGALEDEFFTSLSDAEQKAFTRLYNDFFYHRHNAFWKKQGLQKLPAVTQATRMLPCAEDLGMIPACVPDVLNALQILALEVQRMPKQAGRAFADTTAYPYLSVATPSTHDMSVLRGWWKENAELTQKFWSEVLHKQGDAPAELDTDTCKEILAMHLASPSMLTLIAWQDWAAMSETLRGKDPEKERINIPANAQHYWRYRMPVALEDLLQDDAFNAQIKAMIAEAGR